MAAIKTQNIRRAMLKKGFLQSQTHHEMYYYAIEGKKTSIRTRLSHGAKEYDDYLLGQMAVQLKLEKLEFLYLIDCSLTGDGYFCLLKKRGLIKHFADKQVNVKYKKVSRFSLPGIIDNLNKAIEKLNWQPFGTEWADYYDSTNYSTDAFEHKKAIISEYLERINPKTVWDFGANTGVFSRLASDKGIPTISFDVDPVAVEFDLLFHRDLVRPK